MSPSASPQGTAESVRERILFVAGSLFATKGYDATSVRAIAEGTGVTVPTLYYHFGSKRGILAALIERHYERKTREVRSALTEGSESCAERVVRGLKAYANASAPEGRDDAKLILDPPLSSDTDLRVLAVHAQRGMVEAFCKVLYQGQETGEFRHVDVPPTVVSLLACARATSSVNNLWEDLVWSSVTDRIADLIPNGLRPR